MATEPQRLFVAFRSVPDYTAKAAPFVGVFRSLDGAINALYPDRADFRADFTKSRYIPNMWTGPDGFGHVELVEVGE